jgi:anti-anti-sigma factor
LTRSYIQGVEASRISVAREGDQACVQIVGRGSFQNAVLLKHFYTEVLAKGVRHFTVDLAECTYLDSTFLGTLTGLGIHLHDLKADKVEIIHCNSRITDLFQNLGLDRLFNISQEPEAPVPQPDQVLSEPPPSKEETGVTMLEAHELLMQWDKRNVAKFKDVVAYLKEDLGKTDLP